MFTLSTILEARARTSDFAIPAYHIIENRPIRGIINANLLSLKVIAENKAIPVIGVILGGCGNNLVKTANNIKNDVTIKFLFICFSHYRFR